MQLTRKHGVYITTRYIRNARNDRGLMGWNGAQVQVVGAHHGMLIWRTGCKMSQLSSAMGLTKRGTNQLSRSTRINEDSYFEKPAPDHWWQLHQLVADGSATCPFFETSSFTASVVTPSYALMSCHNTIPCIWPPSWSVKNTALLKISYVCFSCRNPHDFNGNFRILKWRYCTI